MASRVPDFARCISSLSLFIDHMPIFGLRAILSLCPFAFSPSSTGRLWPQSSARTPKPVSLGSSSRISTKPKSISAARSFSLTGDNFVRLALTSRNAQRRRIAVSRSSPASNDFACCARLTALSASLGGATAAVSTAGSTLFGWLEGVGRAGSSSKKVGGEGGSLNISAKALCSA